MNPVPPLTDDESAQLRASIQQDGVIHPVLLDGSGQVIDGHHRQAISDELGIVCPTKTVEVDEATAERLAVTLNLARRHLSTATRYDLIAWLDARHSADAGAAALDNDLKENRSSNRAESVDVIAQRINADLVEMGESMRIDKGNIRRARRWVAQPEDTKARVRNGEVSLSTVINAQGKKMSGRRTRRAPASHSTPRELLDRQAQIRAQNAEMQYQSMLNAPKGKLNLPLLRRLEQIQQYLDDIFELEPEVASVGFPVSRCPEFTTSRAEWWSKFTELCEARWKSEAPELPPARPVRLVPLAERDLTRGDRSMLAWLRTKSEPVTTAEAAVALRCPQSTASNALAKLVGCGLAEEVGMVEKRKTYVAVEPV